MVAGHLQEKKGYFYMVLSYPDAAGKRKTKWLPTGLPVKGNKKKAEKMLMETRQTFVPECKPIHEDMLFSDFLIQWLEIAFNAVDLLNLFHKMFVKLRYFLVRLFSLLKLNIVVFKVIVHIFFNKVFGGHTFYDSVCA